jgi:hypothetical protein
MKSISISTFSALLSLFVITSGAFSKQYIILKTDDLQNSYGQSREN